MGPSGPDALTVSHAIDEVEGSKLDRTGIEPADPSEGASESALLRGTLSDWLSRTWWSVAGVILVLWALRLLGSATTFPWVGAVAVGTGLWGLAVTVQAWLPTHSPSKWGASAWLTLAIALAAFGIWAYLQIYAGPAYGTDEIAFDQFAAHLFIHGVDPYRSSMAAAFARYHVSPDGYTYTLSGRPVTTLSYPALAFLFYAPLLLLGWSTQAAVVVNIGAWMLAVVLLFGLVPRELRAMAIVVGSLSVYASYAVGGVTDALFVPLLIGAVVGWDRCATERGWRTWRSPILMGLALAVKQTPWFVLPFLLTAIFLERRRTGGTWRGAAAASSRYLAISIGVFLVPNLYFIAEGPRAWFDGVLAPFGAHVVPAGQGLIGLSLFLGVGGGSLEAFTIAAALVLAALWVAEIATWPALRASFVLLPSLVLFFATRSFGSYLVELLPATLAAAVTIRSLTPGQVRAKALLGAQEPGPRGLPAALGQGAHRRLQRARRASRRGQRCLLAGIGAGLVALAGIIFALADQAPLVMRIVSVHTTGQLATVDRVVVRVDNRSGRRVHPTFSIDEGGALTTFWRAEGGPSTIPAHRSAAYTLVAPNYPAMPPIGGGFQVVAFTEGPDTVSRTPAYLPTRYHLILSPEAVNTPVAVGRLLTIRAALFNPLDQPIHRGGVPVYLGQIIYAQRGLEYGEVIVNGSPPGQTPVMALTNSQGVASFVVRATIATVDPVYFEANLVNASHFYPYGYSPILMVHFVAGAS